MRTKIATLLLCLSALAGLPRMSSAASAPLTAPAAASITASLNEQALLAQLGAQDPALLKQAAGDSLVIEGGRGYGGGYGGGYGRGWHRHGGYYGDDGNYGYGYGAGALVLTVLLVTLIVLITL
jgi:hypothetical protein